MPDLLRSSRPSVRCSLTRRVNRDGKHQIPGSKPQRNTKHQNSNVQPCDNGVLELGYWRFSGAWMLAPGVFSASVNAKQLAQPDFQSDPSRCKSGHGCHLWELIVDG